MKQFQELTKKKKHGVVPKNEHTRVIATAAHARLSLVLRIAW